MTHGKRGTAIGAGLNCCVADKALYVTHEEFPDLLVPLPESVEQLRRTITGITTNDGVHSLPLGSPFFLPLRYGRRDATPGRSAVIDRRGVGPNRRCRCRQRQARARPRIRRNPPLTGSPDRFCGREDALQGVRDLGEERKEAGDGGIVNWTQQLAGSSKERVAISGLGLGLDRIETLGEARGGPDAAA